MGDMVVGLEARLWWDERQVNENSTEILPNRPGSKEDGRVLTDDTYVSCCGGVWAGS